MIHVACAADNCYAPHCGAMLHSLFSKNGHEDICVHFLCESISDENLDKLTTVCNQFNAVLDVHYIDVGELQGFPTDKFHASCWYRILLPSLLPEVDRVLYLDVDVIILDDLKELWRLSLGDHIFAAAVNPVYPFMAKRIRESLGIVDPVNYLNSGVLLMNLDLMRKHAVLEKVKKYASEHPQNIWPEQDALSVVCKGQWLPLPPRWNVQSTIFDIPKIELPYCSADIDTAIESPAIVHFIGPHKPWHYLCRHPWRHFYHEHRKKSPWGAADIEGRTFLNLLLKPLSLEMQVKAKRYTSKVLQKLASLVRFRIA